MIQLVRY